MNILDFFPKYPQINASKYDELNLYNSDFNQVIYNKKEFRENKLGKSEPFPKEKGMQMKYQKTIARYMSSHTPYDRLLLVHAMGLGKTCSAIGAIEQIKEETDAYNGALILAKGEPILENFMKELVEKCTAGQYLPAHYKRLTELEKIHRIKKKTTFYQLKTFTKFAKSIKKLSDDIIIQNYSNKIIVVDEVHNLRIQSTAASSENDDVVDLETYNEFHRFFHLVKNCKIMFLSGTPMKDSPEEIASVVNLMLPLNEQFPIGKEFLSEYTYSDKGAHILKPEKIPEIKERLRGKISFLREPEANIPKRYLGSSVDMLNHFIVDPVKMSKFQSENYMKAFMYDKSGQRGVFTSSREASLFIYPDGSFGKIGFQKYIIESKKDSGKYTMKEELYNALKGDTPESTLKNIKKYSAVYAAVIEKVLNTNGNCFLYSSVVQGSGAILLSLLFELFNFSRAKGDEKTKGMRYAILTTKTSSTQDIRRILNIFNSKNNMKGEYIKVIIGSRSISEGFSLKNVVYEGILTPHWNYSETAQAIARGVRLNSHADLYLAGENPIIEISQFAAYPRDEMQASIDLMMYKTSEDKDISIRSVLRVLMECAFDCALNYIRNSVSNSEDGSRECDYTLCKYTCDGVDLSDNDIDYSTYNLYYANPKIPAIRKAIESLFRKNNILNSETIFNALKNKYTEEEIENAIFLLKEDEDEVLLYDKFISLYSRSSVKKLIASISKLFKNQFRIDLDNIVKKFPSYNKFEIITALSSMINDSLILTNKYGLACYLKEKNNQYFLVNSLTIEASTDLEYYTEFPHISNPISFSTLSELIYIKNIPNVIRKIPTLQPSSIASVIKSLPLEVQEYFIEGAVDALRNDVKNNVVDEVLRLYKSYIKNVDGMYISTFNNTNKCLENGVWVLCKPNIKDKIRQAEIRESEEKQLNNPYGMLGKYNPENQAFCLVDLSKNKESQDMRLKISGKVCSSGGWKVSELVDLAVNRFKIPPPESYLRNESKSDLVRFCKIHDIETENMDESDMRRALYWSLSRKEGGNKGIKPICDEIKNWMEANNILEIDNMCGVQGKRKIEGDEKEETKQKVYRIELVDLVDEKYAGFNKPLNLLLKSCMNDDKFKLKPDSNFKWLVIYTGKKLLGAFQLDKDSDIVFICLAGNYKRLTIPKQAVRQGAIFLQTRLGKEARIKLKRTNLDLNEKIDTYKNLGFEVYDSNDVYTYMKFIM